MAAALVLNPVDVFSPRWKREWLDPHTDVYPILRFSAVPAQVNVHLIDRPGAPFLGVAAMGPTAGAIGNALFDATGIRLRDMPLAGEPLRSRIAP